MIEKKPMVNPIDEIIIEDELLSSNPPPPVLAKQLTFSMEKQPSFAIPKQEEEKKELPKISKIEDRMKTLTGSILGGFDSLQSLLDEYKQKLEETEIKSSKERKLEREGGINLSKI